MGSGWLQSTEKEVDEVMEAAALSRLEAGVGKQMVRLWLSIDEVVVEQR